MGVYRFRRVSVDRWRAEGLRIARKTSGNHTNGEYNYAMAA